MRRSRATFKTSHLKRTALFKYFVIPVTTFLFRGIARLMGVLPPRGVYAVARSFGLLIWYAGAKRRKIAIRNLEIAFGDEYSPKERRRIARRSVQHFSMTAFDVFLLPRYRGDDWRARVTFTDEQKATLDRLAAHTGPVAFHNAHMGSWEFSTGVANYMGKTLGVVYRPLEFAPIDEEIRRLRTSQGVRAYAKKGALKGYLKTLKNNEWLGVIADQNAGRNAAFVDFFGVPASTEASYFPLYFRFDTLACAGFAIREGFDFRFRIDGLYTTAIDRSADPLDESMRLAQWYMACVENAVRKHPEQHNWMHKRWRSRPNGAPSLYENLGKPLDRRLLQQQPEAPIRPAKWREAKQRI